MQEHVADEHIDRLADRRLLAHQQREWAEIGDGALIGQPQPKIKLARGCADASSRRPTAPAATLISGSVRQAGGRRNSVTMR